MFAAPLRNACACSRNAWASPLATARESSSSTLTASSTNCFASDELVAAQRLERFERAKVERRRPGLGNEARFSASCRRCRLALARGLLRRQERRFQRAEQSGGIDRLCKAGVHTGFLATAMSYLVRERRHPDDRSPAASVPLASTQPL